MKRIKTLTIPLACVAGFALAVSQASAAFIVNGDFEAGNSGFTSLYEYTAVAGGLATGGESPGVGAGKYAVGASANFFHSAFTATAPHGGVNMMVVNGSGDATKTVWAGTVAPPLSIGTTYEFSAWVMNVYPDSPANLRFSFGGNVLGTITPTGNGVWQQFTANFVATAAQTGGLLDLNLAAQGNDFAVDDISLVVVPEPTTMIAGAMLLLPFGASTLRMLRKSRTA